MAHCPSLCLHLLIRTWAENPCPSSPGDPRCPRIAELHSACHSAGLPTQWPRKGRGWATAGPWRVVWSPYPQDKQWSKGRGVPARAPLPCGGGGERWEEEACPGRSAFFEVETGPCPPGQKRQTRGAWDSSTYMCTSDRGLGMAERPALLSGSPALLAAPVCVSRFLWPCVS